MKKERWQITGDVGGMVDLHITLTKATFRRNWPKTRKLVMDFVNACDLRASAKKRK